MTRVIPRVCMVITFAQVSEQLIKNSLVNRACTEGEPFMSEQWLFKSSGLCDEQIS